MEVGSYELQVPVKTILTITLNFILSISEMSILLSPCSMYIICLHHGPLAKCVSFNYDKAIVFI